MITARGLARTFRSRRGDVHAVRGADLDVAEVRRPSLDDVFLSLTGRSLRDEPADAPVGATP